MSLANVLDFIMAFQNCQSNIFYRAKLFKTSHVTFDNVLDFIQVITGYYRVINKIKHANKCPVWNLKKFCAINNFLFYLRHFQSNFFYCADPFKMSNVTFDDTLDFIITLRHFQSDMRRDREKRGICGANLAAGRTRHGFLSEKNIHWR